MSQRQIRPAELMRRTCQALDALYAAGGEQELTLPQVAMMDALKRHGPQTGLALIGLTGIDRATLFNMCERLRGIGLIATVQIESEKPGRNPKAISLTPKGIRALNRCESALWNAEVKLMAKLKPHERSTFLNALAVTAFSGPRP